MAEQRTVNNLNLYSPGPWWHSGAACLAALAWTAWFILIFLVLLGLVDRDWVTGMVAALVFVVAIFASAMGWNKK